MVIHLLLHGAATVLAAVPDPAATPVTSGVAGATGGALPKPPYDELLSYLLQTLIFVSNVAGGLVVGVATLRGLALYVVDLLRQRGREVPKEAIRLSLGRSLSLALEFQVGADILGTALNPSLQDLLTLGAIVILRTVLNFFLGRELAEAERRQVAPANPGRDSRAVNRETVREPVG